MWNMVVGSQMRCLPPQFNCLSAKGDPKCLSRKIPSASVLHFASPVPKPWTPLTSSWSSTPAYQEWAKRAKTAVDEARALVTAFSRLPSPDA